MPPLILASTSSFRQELLARLQIPFQTAAPETDETPLAGESPSACAERLAVLKAQAVAQRFPQALIIGSDQVAYLAADPNQRFAKPGNRENAIAQLKTMRGKTVIFHTALCLLNTATQRTQIQGVPTEVKFRSLSDDEIERYLTKEDALNCAGSAKSEGLGIALLEYMRGDDPNALIGLPLIALCAMLRTEGMEVP